MKAIFINGSPRKNMNTAKMPNEAMQGAESAGSEAELINLYSINFLGCKSCFACKIKNSKTIGVCAPRGEFDNKRHFARQKNAAKVAGMDS